MTVQCGWQTIVIPSANRLRQEGCYKFKTSFHYIANTRPTRISQLDSVLKKFGVGGSKIDQHVRVLATKGDRSLLVLTWGKERTNYENSVL